MGKVLTYQKTLESVMRSISHMPNVLFVGYNVAHGPRMNSTLNYVPKSKCIEMPVAENLVAGIAMGLSLEGYKVIMCIERMDFLLVCADAIINHMCKLPKLSGNQFDFNVIIRTCVGSGVPLDPGPQHTQDLGYIFGPHMRVIPLREKSMIKPAYQQAVYLNGPTMIIEYRDLYES